MLIISHPFQNANLSQKFGGFSTKGRFRTNRGFLQGWHRGLSQFSQRPANDAPRMTIMGAQGFHEPFRILFGQAEPGQFLFHA
jgi:hypothetical protein